MAFIDSDDLWIKKKLEKQIKFMNNFNYDFTYTDYKVCNKNKTKTIVKYHPSLEYNGE